MTFRKSLPNSDSKCTCTFVDHCPSQKSVSKLEEMDENTAIQLEKMHVHTGAQIQTILEKSLKNCFFTVKQQLTLIILKF